MKSQPISACVCKAKMRNLGIRVRVGRSAPPGPYRVKALGKVVAGIWWKVREGCVSCRKQVNEDFRFCKLRLVKLVR